MRITFSASFDNGAWPGPLASKGAVFDEAWVGPLGLLKILETALGEGGAHGDVTRAERAAMLVPSLRATKGAWSKSLDADPLAVARAVLRVRDALVDGGLDATGDGVWLPERLREIVDVTRGLVPGSSDRWSNVARALSDARVDVDELELCEPESWLSPAMSRAIAGLRASGVRVVARDARADVANDGTDLARSRTAPFAPVHDGSLELLRADCPEEAAAEVAAHLASLPADEAVVVVGPDALLDVGLARRNLPTIGARGERGDDALLQVAPLVVALAWPERDPERAFELLTLPVPFVRRKIAAPLARALIKEPAVHSDEWNKALDKALAGMPDDEVKAARQRLVDVFGDATSPSPSAAQGAAEMPLAVLERRLTIVNAWLQRRVDRESDAIAVDKVRGAIGQVASLRRIARGFGNEKLTRTELLRVVEQATAGTRPMRARPALAGLASVRDPGAVVGPCAHVVWWSFTQAAEPAPRTPWWSAQERALLAEHGVHVADAAELAERRAALFQRPLAHARSSLVLCCPRRDRVGDAAHPHPLWDEIVARAHGDSAREQSVRTLEVSTLLERNRGGAAKKVFKTRDVASSSTTWRFPAGALKRPEIETATRAETLLGCTFRAALERAGLHARPRRLPDATKLFGDLAHDVLARVLEARPVDAHDASLRAGVIFDERVPRRAAIFLRPVEATQRTRARELVMRAAERLVEILGERKLSVRHVELDVERGIEGRKMKGRIDLVVGDPLVVLDHKSGKDDRRLRELERGTAIQLAVYAALLKEPEGAWPGIGYFQVRSRRLLTTEPALGGDQTIDTAYPVSWTAARIQRNAQSAERDLASGFATSPGVGERLYRLRSSVEDGELRVAPPCWYCDFGLLCGRALPDGSVPRPGSFTQPIPSTPIAVAASGGHDPASGGVAAPTSSPRAHDAGTPPDSGSRPPEPGTPPDSGSRPPEPGTALESGSPPQEVREASLAPKTDEGER